MYIFAVGSKRILLFVVFLAFASTIAAQSAANSAVTVSSAVKNAAAEPFAVGENLTYEAKWSKSLLRGIDVADLNFKIIKAPDGGGNRLLFQGEAISKGTLMKIARFSFLQKIDSTVDANNFRILHTIRRDEQKDRIRDGEAQFDYKSNRVVYREIDPNNPERAPRTITSPLETATHDLLSAVYFLRRQPLAVGKDFELSVSDAGVIYRIPVKVVAREQLKTVLGKVWTLRVEPEVFGDRRLVPGEGKMIIWFTDDARHLPVRSQIQADIGKIEIKLKQAEGLVAAK
ncbi:MAG TPA: DUF3108 domain-containing protein [Pyrinomonadaceae bacterium]|nr:DUF3108 domain-containing protein [Pyrinomonadaceae bacterium]